ncbi:PD-(D/E)XK nuclease family protein [Oceanidesulfovibrio marinus]|uniref:PD-(D/E)XK endonuclease-like domain-containing protein n=1 Tax=Oceanidesulfovibrio marinus TaxID=370038 RepID=A0A6P1ZB69_9BACT|nr:PD-(D/E)XK nuclease family protein [Oceanidesulfovibrio marinus]TVM31204.1 hypothetical protein DQK91_19025 [Oceanidesulfovibrio marinus]
MLEYLSQSMISSWELCPERFRRRFLEGEIIPPGIAARIGTGVHKGAEINHIQKIHTGEDEPKDVIQDAARDGYKKALEKGVFFAPGEASTAKKQLADGVDTVVTLAGLYRDSLAPQVQPTLVEETIYLDDSRLPIPFRGTIDVLAVDGKDRTWLPDIKTASAKWGQSKADESPQASLYSRLVLEATGHWPDKVSFEVFVKTKTPAHQSVETVRRPEDYDILVVRAQAILAVIERGIFPPAQAGSWTCSPKWCGFWWSCKYIPTHKKDTR